MENSKEDVMPVSAFLSGVMALVFAGLCGAATKAKDVQSAFGFAFIAFMLAFFSVLAIDTYYNPSFLENSSGSVVASYASFAETPKDLWESGKLNYVFIIRGDDGKEYKITIDDLLDRNMLLKSGDRVSRTKGGVKKLN